VGRQSIRLGDQLQEHKRANMTSGLINCKTALELMDEVDKLIRYCAVSAPRERYIRSAEAFWDVCHMLGNEDYRQFHAKVGRHETGGTEDLK
jgi:hypothetical protein